MRKLCAILLLASYIAFVPVCFAGSTAGVLHVHEGGASGATGTTHDTTAPIATHAEMYDFVTSAKFTESPSPVGGPTFSVSLYVFALCFAICFVILSNSRVADRHRRMECLLSYRKTFLHYLARLIASPNFSYVLA